jgi:hypothetical protein
MTASLPDTTSWTPPEAPPRLIRRLAQGEADALSGRYLHAEHDADLEALAARADDIRRHDLNAIRLRRLGRVGGARCRRTGDRNAMAALRAARGWRIAT